MRILLVYGTGEGQTQKIARFVAGRLAAQGHQVRSIDAGDGAPAPAPGEFDAILIAASVHAGRYQSAVVDFVRKHLGVLNAKPNAFLSVSLSAAGSGQDDFEGLRRCVGRFQRQTGWTPARIQHAAGAFRYTKYGLLTRWAMKYIAWRKGAPTDASRDHELTDWSELARFADGFAAAASAAGT